MNIGIHTGRWCWTFASASRPVHRTCFRAINSSYPSTCTSSRNASTSKGNTAEAVQPVAPPIPKEPSKRSRRPSLRQKLRARRPKKNASVVSKTDLKKAVSNVFNALSSTESESRVATKATRLPKRLLPPHLKGSDRSQKFPKVEGVLEPSEEPPLQNVRPTQEHNPIATLAHGLDRVLFNPGVHWLKDPHSRVYNFPPYIEMIPKVTDFAFERLRGFVKSSRDEELWGLARQEKRKFAGSTSSLSGMLSHIYFLISGDKEVNTNDLSRHFGKEPRSFTDGQRMPTTVLFNHDNGVYAIDSYKDGDNDGDKNILTWMGTLLEKYLTAPPEEFKLYMRSSPESLVPKSQLRDAYRFSKSKEFVMRSQLDCYDPRLPGTGVFDIKTRACLPIRMDLLNFEENSGYLIRYQTGKFESFEREYYDLIRSAFLKYSFQVRIGDMDGVMVAYHNTARLFGFQYIPLAEMDAALFGPGQGTGDRVFEKCIGILEKVANEIVACYPGESVKCTFEKEAFKEALNVWVEPAEWKGEGEKPVRQLVVTVSNMLNGDPVRGSTAINTTGSPWTTNWAIRKLPLKDQDVRKDLEAAQKRQFRYYDIPTGWDPDSVSQFWAGLNFSGQTQVQNISYNPSNFRMPGPRIQSLRQLARDGKLESDRVMSLEKGLPKVYLSTQTFGGGNVREAEPTTKERDTDVQPEGS